MIDLLSIMSLGATHVINNSILVPIFGQPIYVVAGALAGTISGFAFSNPTESRKMLFLVSFACVVVGCASTSILPDWLGWKWYKVEKHASSLAIITALISRWVIPMFIKKADQFVDKLLSLKPSKGE